MLNKSAEILGKYLLYLGIALCIPFLVAAYYQFIADPKTHPQPHSTLAFLGTLLICLVFSQCLRFLGRSKKEPLYRRESILVVVLIWIVTGFVSALPFYFSRTLTSPVDAYFEAISGLTTTGATMIAPKAYDPITGAEIPIYITNPKIPEKTYTYFGTVAPVRDPETGLVLYSGVEAVGKAILLWRSLLQWIGGIGIIVIFLTVLPALGVGGKFLYQFEMTGPIKEELTPRIRDTASKIWRIYLFLTVIEILLLLATNHEMPFFDALCVALSNISTGGFSVRNDSIASYHNGITEFIVIVFMLIGSINFSLLFHAAKFKFSRIYVPDFFLFLSIAALGSLIVSSLLIGTYTIPEALRIGLFQALSSQTTTGFSTIDYDLWPFSAQMFMLLLMFIGGMSGSTAGGIKTSRFYILYKIVLHRLESLYRPDSIRKLRIGNTEVDDKNALTVLSFFCIIAFFVVIGTVFFVLDGVDPETSFGLIASFLNNVGLSFRGAGPSSSLMFLSPFSKIFATFWMLLGRLEFFVILLLFLPTFWRNR